MMANANSTGYVGMDTSPVQATINNAKTNLNNQVCITMFSYPIVDYC